MPEIPLDELQARYLFNLVKIHLKARAPAEAEVTAERDEVGRIILRRDRTCWSADGDGVIEVTVADDGRERRGRWRFGSFSGRGSAGTA